MRGIRRPGGSPWVRPQRPDRDERDRPPERPRDRRADAPPHSPRQEPRRPEAGSATPSEAEQVRARSVEDRVLKGPEVDLDAERRALADDTAMDETGETNVDLAELEAAEDEVDEGEAEEEEEEPTGGSEGAEDEADAPDEDEDDEGEEDEEDEENEEEGEEDEAGDEEAEVEGEVDEGGAEADTATPPATATDARSAPENASAEAAPTRVRAPERRPDATQPHRALPVGRLRGRLLDLDGQVFRAYRDIEGEYSLDNFVLLIDFVQPDPYGLASRLRVRVSLEASAIPARLYETPARSIALRDFLTRRFAAAIERHVRGQRGTGDSGQIKIAPCGQEILERSSCVITPEYLEVRFTAALPTDGRSVLGRQALAMLLDELPNVVKDSLLYSALGGGVHRHVEAAEDQEALRAQLADKRLVSFVADGSILPRAGAESQRPLEGSGVVPFESPPELRVELETPNRGTVAGMGVPQGVTLIVGGGFHGKSTLLEAIESGIYNHVPGDGREYVVTRPDAVKIRAEAGRSIERVDISPFLDDLPFGKETSSFTTDDAAGSTSQAAGVVEALEVGTRLLLVDEDTSAGSFLLRDARMQRLIPKADEPITPFVDQVRALQDDYGISTVLAMGGSADYVDVADTVIAMRSYRPRVVTAEARELARQWPAQRTREARTLLRVINKRSAAPESVDPSRRGRDRIQTRGLKALDVGDTRVDLSALDQLVDLGQTRAIADLIGYCVRRGYFDNDAPIVEVLGRGLADAGARGIEVLAPFRSEGGDYAKPRLYEAVAALNRLRGLRAKQVGG